MLALLKFLRYDSRNAPLRKSPLRAGPRSVQEAFPVFRNVGEGARGASIAIELQSDSGVF